MISPIDKEAHYRSLLKKYQSRIPSDLKDILLPDEAQMSQLAITIKRLRIKEEERNYVIEIQRRYRIPLRPNESVKRTMIRVRLAILRKRRDADEGEDIFDLYGPLPIDPLE